ncbi:DNA polymerase alpha subunit A [Xylona heveae TC161]|uniref:DNA polymerase n=1 Tax=Xylona heveae (strain CBS 132557 / TC161) TaxID=1328760 RepID=A0A165GXB3_XYLHT|nr:DNA polymerase alpha subunit A [Xylona heveae TC161]KZF22718.1 DNA polymerase alpha subunit A [Xylona heveae TC161]
MSRRGNFAELRALRASGKKRLATYEVEEEKKLFEEVDEEGYKKVVRDRLNQDDFVIDDNGEGYADDGREDWTNDQRYGESESEEDAPLRGKAAKRKREEDRSRQEKIRNGINKYFSAGPVASAPKPKPVTSAEDAAFMADLLGEVDSNITSKRVPPSMQPIKSESRRKTRILSPPLSENREGRMPTVPQYQDESRLPDAGQDGKIEDDDNDDIFQALDNDVPMSDPQLPSSPVAKALERKGHLPALREDSEEEEDDKLEVARASGDVGGRSTRINISGSRPAPRIKKETTYPTPASSSPTRPPSEAVDASAWNDVTTRLRVLKSSTHETSSIGKLQPQDAIEEDGSLRMFWLDYTEVNGSLCLFGKVKNKRTGEFVSCFVKVDNILRKLYFLPREFRQRNGRDTSEEVDMKNVYDEVDELMSRQRVGMYKIKPCTRKYAFELPDIPQEADYLKLLYPYDKPALPTDLRGGTFSHVFGSNTALFEQFVLWKNIMGPCWLKIEEADFTAVNNASWCKLELQVSKPNVISPLGDADNLEAPPLTLMSLSLRTTLNVKENKQEILLASARVYENVSLSDTTPPEKLATKTFTVMRPTGQSFPIGFQAEAEKHIGTVKLERNEQGILSYFLAILQRIDPDVLVGHQLEGVDYNILLNRLREKKTPGWHRIGRLRRSEWPKNIGKVGGSFFAERQLVAGRLLCDLANDLGKSLMTKCQSWSLTEMCKLVLGPNSPRTDLDNEAALKTWASSREGLMNYLRHCEADTYFIAAIALKVQMLPLTKVLTNLAGNSWARTLSGTRAERNEYILLHEFHRNKFICPDKATGKWKQKAEEENDEGEDGLDVKKKDKYKGGLVFEPEKGLYDRFILVMDFNSLYPSIIQEYNICFTTVDRSHLSEDDEKVPDVPKEQNQGILPRLIATLVSRRRQVKSLMKDKRATPDQLATWDIKQLALKLTANSMYGCLGYTRSRFYARPLAMLTTFKGREILRSTKDLAETSQLRVIYGDTDSVMINTNTDTLEDALKLGSEFRRAVNERYKLLEIDIDNIFRRLLLHAKKKYAAINMVEVDGKYVDKLEVKGLDMRRREYCALSKEASSHLLNEILSGDDPEVVIGKIHDYLQALSEKMRQNAVPSQKYIIYTKLGKHPKEYPNPDSMPQVQVALREISKGKAIRANDVMAYIVTGDSKSSESAAKRSYTPQDVLKADSGLKPVDVEWYLYKQIFPPVERLCAPIDGTDPVRLAECLGLDTRKYQISSSSNNQQDEIFPLESQIPDDVRFKDAIRLKLRCRFCKETMNFDGLVNSLDLCSRDGIVCPNKACNKNLPTISVVAQLESQIRQQTANYYSAWLSCDDPACGNRTRQMSVYGHRCLGPKGLAHGCLGRMTYEYTEKMMYNQLLYFQSLWDVEKAKTKAAGENKEKILALVEFNRERFDTLKGVVQKYLDKCGRQWVAMDSLFAFALKTV